MTQLGLSIIQPYVDAAWMAPVALAHQERGHHCVCQVEAVPSGVRLPPRPSIVRVVDVDHERHRQAASHIHAAREAVMEQLIWTPIIQAVFVDVLSCL